jgi:cytochrome oxidase Cu insertion factor (SCO1/SenC/PrrC family)
MSEFRLLMVPALMCASLVALSAQKPPDPATLGPAVGQAVPSFTLPDQNGVQTSLKSILGANGALLVFSRSADW